MNPTKTFNDVMRGEEFAPGGPAKMPAMPTGTDAAGAWQRAISGAGKPLGLGDTVESARQWMSQPFAEKAAMDPKITQAKA